MPGLDIDYAGWLALGDGPARRHAERIADAVDAQLTELLIHYHHGRPMRLALFRRNDITYSLVPGGEVAVGFDADRYEPSPDILDLHAAQQDRYRAQDDFEPSDIGDLVAELTTPARTVTIAPLLVAVDAHERGFPLRPPNALPIEDVTYTQICAELATRGERLCTPDEWEYACGGGVRTLWRWGDAYPVGSALHPFASAPTLDSGDPAGIARMPSLFGLRIGQDPYRCERTTEPDVMCGGDGGIILHHSGYDFERWLTLATAFRDREFGTYVVDNETKPHWTNSMWIRPVIPLA